MVDTDHTLYTADPSLFGQSSVRRRAPRRYPGSSSLVDATPVPVNTKYDAAALASSELVEVAHIFSRLECEILDFVREVMRVEDKIKPSEENKQTSARFEKTRQALVEVHSGSCQFSAGYLKDTELLAAWAICAKVHRDHLKHRVDDRVREKLGSTARLLEIIAAPLQGALKFAVFTGCLDVVTKSAIGAKYTRLDEIVNVVHEQTKETRDLPTWHEISQELLAFSSRPPVPDAKAISQNMSTVRLSWILWITFFVTVACGGPMLAQAWNYSEHQPGSWAEEDFFFLLQGCIMQVFGLIVTAIALTKNKSVPVAAWALPSVLTLVLTLVSPVLYCFVPKWWSSFCTLVAASIQAFLVLQLALYSA